MPKNDAPTPSRRGLMLTAAAGSFAVPMGCPMAGTAQGADAELLRLCAAWEANWDEGLALMEPYYDAVGGWPPDLAARLGRMTREGHRLADRIAALPAATSAGAAAKARLALRVLDSAEGGWGRAPGGNDGLPWSACRDMLALAEGAA